MDLSLAGLHLLPSPLLSQSVRPQSEVYAVSVRYLSYHLVQLVSVLLARVLNEFYRPELLKLVVLGFELMVLLFVVADEDYASRILD